MTANGAATAAGGDAPAGASGGVVIVGASGGIGTAVVRRLAAAGTPLSLAARGAEGLETVAAGTNAHVATLDARDVDAVDAFVAEAAKRHGRLVGVVNLAGSLLLKPAHLTSVQEWDDTIGANLTTAFAVVRAAARAMSDGGSVVLMASAAARVGLASHEAIAAAKAGVIGLAQSAAASYASRGLRVNVVAPGLVQTGLSARITSTDAGRKASLAMHPLGQLGEAEDVASAIVWLLAAEQRWVTGQVFGVDGGLATVRARA